MIRPIAASPPGAITLEIAGTAVGTEAEGPHRRFAVWVQGCTLACPGCCNPEMFVRGRGRTIEVPALNRAISEAAQTAGVEGITVLGGEPLQQLGAVAALCEAAAAAGLGVIVFTGHTLAEARGQVGFERLWACIDTLVDGRFDARQPDAARRFVGSRNQTLVHRTPRYADPSLWQGEPTVELVLTPGEPLRLVGAPALARRVVRSLRGGS
ncbi:MAG: radical SAM protein [Myxococcales bacterium]|nr:radical SAM protein [Myxococcales bacterium]